MSDARDLSGVWYGRYDGDGGEQSNGFIALLEDFGGILTGSISELDSRGPGIRRADAVGVRTGSSVRFTKQYDGSGGWHHSVAYQGNVDDRGTVIEGAWQVEWVQGRFTMQREKFTEEELDAEEEAERALWFR